MNKRFLSIFIIAIFFASNSLDSGLFSVTAQEVEEVKWVLVDTIINPDDYSLVTEETAPGLQGTKQSLALSETALSINYRLVFDGVWVYDSIFRFTWDKPPDELQPGESIELSMTGEASWKLNETAYFNPAIWVTPRFIEGAYSAIDHQGIPRALIEEIGVEHDPDMLVGPPYWEITEPPSRWERGEIEFTETESKSFRLSVPQVVGLETIDETLTIYAGPGIPAVKWMYQPLVPRAPMQPKFSVDPTEAYPDDEISCEGANFPPKAEVTLHWDSPDGPEVGRTKTDKDGDFEVPIKIPPDADPRIHTVYAKSNSTVLSAQVTVLEWLCVSGFVKIRFIEGLPLRDVIVELWRTNSISGGRHLLVGNTSTNERGFYRICNSSIQIPSGLYYFKVYLAEFRQRTRDLGIRIIDNSTAKINFNDLLNGSLPLGENFNVTFGKDGNMGVSDNSQYFQIRDQYDLERDLWFTYFHPVDDNSDTPVREDHAFNAAIIYYHTHQAMRFYRDVLGVNVVGVSINQWIDDRPMCRLIDRCVNYSSPIYIHCVKPGIFSIYNAGIFMDDWGSLYSNGNAPKNREYHEYSHWMMDQFFGEMPIRSINRSLLWSEANITESEWFDFNDNGRYDQDVSNGGYSFSLYPKPWLSKREYNELSSSDGWTEGVVEFMSLAIADHYRNSVFEPFWLDLLPNYIYPIGHPFPRMHNLELNLNPSDHYGEQFTVASILWDIYDPVKPSDHDNVQMSIRDIWRLINSTHEFPEYYIDGTTLEMLNFTGDGYTYSTIPWIREAQEASGWTSYPMEERNITYVKDLYDVLAEAAESDPMLSLEAVDEIFRAHREFLNTFYVYDDYSIPPLLDGNIVMVEDDGSSIHLDQSTPPAHFWWSNGFEVTVDNTGWGSGFMVEKTFDATGWLYAWVWVDAPEGIEMSVVVEDWDGEWISPFTSNGQGFNQPHVAILGPRSFFSPDKNGFIPNPHHNTPENEYGPRIYFQNQIPVKKIGLLFHTPGSYTVDIGPIVLIRGYPWRPGMFQIMGIGDPGASSFRPYRRNTPPIDSASVQISIDEVPAVLNVEMKYAPPYDDLSFTYPLTLTEKTSSVGLFIEPSTGEVDNEIIISVEKEGYLSSEPISISGSHYGENLGKKEHVMEVSFDLEPEPSGGLVVRDHLLCTFVDASGEPKGTTDSFYSDENVYSWLSVADVKEGDMMTWLFKGPNSIEIESEIQFDWSGEGSGYAYFSLSEFDSQQVVGDWIVTVSVNGEEVLVDYFEVTKAGSDVLILAFILIAVGIPVVIFIFWWRRRSRARRKQAEPVTARPDYCVKCGAKLNPLDEFCGECGNRIKDPLQKDK